MADIGIHLDGEHYQADVTHTLTPQVGLAANMVGGDFHNHGPDDLTVSGYEFATLVNATISGVLAQPGIIGTYESGMIKNLGWNVTPTTYGAYSFDVIVTSDASNTPVLTVTFEGMAYGTQVDIGWTAPNRRLEWTAPNRRLEWTAV